MRILVTGASGFIGRNLLLALPRDWEISATWNRDASLPEFLRAKGLGHVCAVRVDLGDRAAVEGLDARMKSHDACVHLAANGDPAYSAQAPAEDLRANALALLNVVSACRFGHFLFFSSGAVYDGLRGPVDPRSALAPTLPYAISKWAAERYVMHAQREGRVGIASIVRFFGAYGPYEPARKIYGRLVRQFAFERTAAFTIRGDGRNLIDAMHVDDAVRAIRLILDRARESATFDLCSGRPLTLVELARLAAARFGIEPRIDFVGEVPEYIEFRSVDRAMQARFGFTPAIDLPEGLERFRAWMQEESACPTIKTA